VIRGEEGSDSSEVLRTEDALRLAEEEGLDLVEVAPNQEPPVCRLMDYGKFKFAQSKKASEARRSRARTDQREVRMKVRIGEHDIQSKVRRVRDLLGEGAKVKISVFFRGREIDHPELAVKLLRRVAESVASEAKLERAPTMEGRSLSIILAPARGQPATSVAGVAAGAED
jgi:translation initiation factor IF-3